MHDDTSDLTVFADPDFSWTTWSAADITALEEPILALLRIDLETIKSVPADERNFNNTVRAIDLAFAEVREVLFKLEFVTSTSPDKAARDTGVEVTTRIQQALIDISYDEALYEAVRTYADRKEPLEGPEAKLLAESLREYRRMGFELPLAEREELKRLSKEMADLENRFTKNVNDAEGSIVVTPEEAAGIPETVLARFAKADAGYRVTLKYPDYFPFMENAANADKRRELAELYFRRGGQENLDLMRQIVALRARQARMLGYENHAAYRTETRMAKTAQAAVTFEDDLFMRLRPGVDRDVEALRALKREDGKEDALAFYDVAYYVNQDKKRRFDIDDEAVRPYFPMQKVIAGMFDIYQTLLGVTFVEDPTVPKLHPDATAYRIEDEGRTVAYFYMDLHPRDGKYGHAAAFSINLGRELETGASVMPVAGLVCNFTKPTATEPSLLTHGEVETFFHEFGHIMHETLCTAAYASQSPMSVAWDFIEAPSQMLENWIWDPAMLAKVSGHYQTGEAFPAAMLEKLLALKRHFQAYYEGRQLLLGTYDLRIHTAAEVPDLQKLYSELHQQMFGIPFPENLMQAAGFGHLIGYSAGYYGYLWSKVYAADMFTRFEQEGLLNPTTGRAYRMWILEKGSSLEEIDLVRGFLGREPNNEAFLKEIGVA